jgi:manganese/iron transport system substrate-binding protein
MVANLVKEIKNSQIPMIFVESSVNPQLIETVAKEAQVKVSSRSLYTDSLGEKGTEADTYQKMLIANTRTLVEGLGGNFSPFQNDQP